MEFLNYHHLRYFWAVAKEGGLRKAAEKLHVSQPTISAQIAALESVLGEKLFWRTGRNLVLTETGQQVLGYAEEIFSIGQELLSSVKQRPTLRPLRMHLVVADALPKLVAYRIIEPIFRLPQPVQVSCWEAKVFGHADRIGGPSARPRARGSTGIQRGTRQCFQSFPRRMRHHVLCRAAPGRETATRLSRVVERSPGAVADVEQRVAPLPGKVVSLHGRSSTIGRRN